MTETKATAAIKSMRKRRFAMAPAPGVGIVSTGAVRALWLSWRTRGTPHMGLGDSMNCRREVMHRQ